MATTVAALRGQMGSVTFYQTKMRARELTAIARPASELDSWTTLGIDERLQRELNDKRVREEIVPYLAKFDDRFFGSLLVLIQKPDLFDYEPAGKYLAKDVPAAYRKTLEQMGALTIDGGQLIVLDGQHRLAALRSVVQGKTDKGTTIVGPHVADVPNDELVVVFIEYTSDETTRRIFNKINKNAKPTGRSDNIITSEDDANAISLENCLKVNSPWAVSTPPRTARVSCLSTGGQPRLARAVPSGRPSPPSTRLFLTSSNTTTRASTRRSW